MKEERNKTLHQTKLSIIFSFGYIGAQSDITQVTTLNKKTLKAQLLRLIGHKEKVTYSEL